MSFRLEFCAPRSGWMEGRAAATDGEVTFAVSYLTDAPADLLRAVLAVLQGAAEATCACALEPEELRWRVQRQAGMVTLRLLRFPRWPSSLDDEVGLLALEAVCAPLRVASQLHGALRQVRNRIGPEQYEREWRHPFPDELLERLKTAIDRMKARDG